MYENQPFTDGEPAFGIEGTFTIGTTIYVLNKKADKRLKQALDDDRGFELTDHFKKALGDEHCGYHARASWQTTPEEIMDSMFSGAGSNSVSFLVYTTYMDRHKHSLAEPDIHEKILLAAGQRRDTGYYNRPNDQFSREIIDRMNAFVRHVVDVSYEAWESFIQEAQHYHSASFIIALARWASENSDGSARPVKCSQYDTNMISPDDPFTPHYPPDRGHYSLHNFE